MPNPRPRPTRRWEYPSEGYDMSKDFNTLEDFVYKDKTVLLRVDINLSLIHI